MGGSELRAMAIAGVRAILVSNPAVSQYADDVLAVLEGRKIAVERAVQQQGAALQAVMKPKEVAELLRVHIKTLERYAREGYLERVKVPGKGQSIGYTRASVERWLGGNTTGGKS